MYNCSSVEFAIVVLEVLQWKICLVMSNYLFLLIIISHQCLSILDNGQWTGVAFSWNWASRLICDALNLGQKCYQWQKKSLQEKADIIVFFILIDEMWYQLLRLFLKCLVVTYEFPLQILVKTWSQLSPSVSMGSSNIHLILGVTSFHICIHSGKFFHSTTIKTVKKKLKHMRKLLFNCKNLKNKMIHKL